MLSGRMCRGEKIHISTYGRVGRMGGELIILALLEGNFT